MKILIIDDEEMIRDGIEKRIIKYGYTYEKIFKAMDAHMAQRIIEKEEIDLAFVDINMPFMNGLEFIEQYQDTGIRFVIISGYDKFEYAKKAIELGVIRYLLKPIDKQEFIQVMDYMVETIDQLYEQKEYSKNVKLILDCIHNNYTDMNFSLANCADKIQLSESTISKLLRKELSINFNDLVNKQRIQLAISLMAKNDEKIKMSELAATCGFATQQYFSVVFKKYTGQSPSQYLSK